jgi:hypothetical protein
MKPLVTLFFATCLFGVSVCTLFAQTNPSSTNLSDADKLKVLEKSWNEWRENQKSNPPVYSRISIYNTSCSIVVLGHTNFTAYEPLRSQAFEIHLFDAMGKEIQKTAYGKSFGLPLKPDKALQDGSFDYTGEALWGHLRTLNFTSLGGGSGGWEFRFINAFRIKQPSEYRLQVQVRLFTKDTNGVFQPFLLPPVETKVNITTKDLGH